MICYCKFIIIIILFLHFSHSEIIPPITINLTMTRHLDNAMFSYHMLNWTIEDQAIVTHFILKILRHVKAVQDFSAGCSTNIGPQIDVPFIK